MKEHYHHGNLKNELIEVGIKIISEEGFDHLSLRNISKQCGVSHNAIYRHFDDKEQMYRNSSIRIVFTMDEIPENYPPYEVFRKVYLAIAEKKGESKEDGLKQLLRYWSLMHGAISLLISPNVELSGNTENYLKDFF